jgi:hypothetical protein
MNNAIRKAGWVAAVAVPALFAAQGASAALVTDWNFRALSAFTEWTPESDAEGAVTPSNPNEDFDGNPTTLSWGVAENQSSISIDPAVEGTVQTNGDFEQSATFTHNNFPIRDPNDVSLESFLLSTRLVLTATAPPEMAGDTETLPLDFPSLFFESPNVENCGFESESNCDDIFVLGGGDATNLNEEGIFEATTGFTLDDITYTVLLEIEGLGALTSDQCGAAGAGAGCVGFLTQESQVNNFTSRFAIRAEVAEVPEPGTLGLLGLGLAGLGFAGRRRRAAR